MQKISSVSTTSLLNITLFLWFHISVFMVTHMPFQILFTLGLRYKRQKLSKWTNKDSCLTKTLPTHLSQEFHTLCTTLQVLKRCWALLSHSWHIGHWVLPNCGPLLIKLSLVGSLSNNNIQTRTSATGATLILQISQNNSRFSNSSSWFRSIAQLNHILLLFLPNLYQTILSLSIPLYIWYHKQHLFLKLFLQFESLSPPS